MTSYTLYFDSASNGLLFLEFESGITDTSYTATGLTQGSNYQWKVQAVNGYGPGLLSDPIAVLAA